MKFRCSLREYLIQVLWLFTSPTCKLLEKNLIPDKFQNNLSETLKLPRLQGRNYYHTLITIYELFVMKILYVFESVEE